MIDYTPKHGIDGNIQIENENHWCTKYSNELFIIANIIGYDMEWLGDTMHTSTCGCKGLSCAKQWLSE